MTDPIADMLSRIRNANNAGHSSLEAPASKQKIEILNLLKDEGYIKGYECIENKNHKSIKVQLKYGPSGEKVIHGLKRISKPGLRVYSKQNELPRVLGGLGTAVISTSKGIMSDKEARKNGHGGEVLCYIW